jgi:hypothetical protein
MGNYQSIFEETPDQQKATITADQKTWITEHVELTGCTIKWVFKGFDFF